MRLTAHIYLGLTFKRCYMLELFYIYRFCFRLDDLKIVYAVLGEGRKKDWLGPVILISCRTKAGLAPKFEAHAGLSVISLLLTTRRI